MAGREPTLQAHDGAGLTKVVEVERRGYGTCALSSDGAVWCWGCNFGQLGPDRLNELITSPTRITVTTP